MLRLLLLLASSIFLASCASGYLGQTVQNQATISYEYKKDNVLGMTMKLKFKAKPNSQFIVKLKPKGSDSNDVMITVTGVSGTLPANNGTTSFTWLNGSGSYNSTKASGNSIILNVPPGVPVGTWYKFDISVEGIGTIDPRVDVN